MKNEKRKKRMAKKGQDPGDTGMGGRTVKGTINVKKSPLR